MNDLRNYSRFAFSSGYLISVEKMVDFEVFKLNVTDRQTNRPTDRTSYRDARTHLKIYFENRGLLNRNGK